MLEPARGLLGYGILLVDSLESADTNLKSDARRIQECAQRLYDLVNGQLDNHLISLSPDTSSLDLQRRARHELRTPITGIIGYAEMMLEDFEGFGPQQLKDDLLVIVREAQAFLTGLEQITITPVKQKSQPPNLELRENQMLMATDITRSIQESDKTRRSEKTGRILVVDDVEINRNLLERRLVQDGHSVTKMPDGKSALAILKETRFDLVLLDLMMPEMNGFDVLNRMKSNSTLRSIPVIVISALEETDSALRCIEAGAHDYLPKPFSLTMLRARIHSGLESKQWSDVERQQREFIHQAFTKFVSPQVVSELVENPSSLVLGGERIDISYVLTDLQGFTPMVENSQPGELTPVLNRYLAGLCDLVLRHEGTIDKIVGDAMHAFFGAPLKQENHSIKALQCAIDIDKFARKFSNRPEARQLGFGRTRIGVNSGVGLVGNFGGDSFFNYTVYGDVVNTAARIENANKYLGTSICVTAETATRCDSVQFRPAGRLMLKGKSNWVDAFEPVYESSSTQCPFDLYSNAYKLMEDYQTSALTAIFALRQKYPEDPLLQLHHNRLLRGESGSSIYIGTSSPVSIDEE